MLDDAIMKRACLCGPDLVLLEIMIFAPYVHTQGPPAAHAQHAMRIKSTRRLYMHANK